MIGPWRTGGFALLLGAGLLLAPVAAPGLMAQADTARQAEPSLGELRERIEGRYRVLPVQRGVVLLPRYTADVQTIELSDGDIALDGQSVTGAELRDRLSEDADAILRLSYLETDTRRALFGIGETPAATLPDTTGADTLAAGPAAPDAPEDAEALEDLEDESHQGDRVRVGGSVRVGPGERIDGDVVAVGGSARIDGSVDGDVTAVGGAVHLGPDARVDGDVISVGGRVHKAPGAVVRGSIQENDFAFGDWSFTRGAEFEAPFFAGVGGLLSTVVWIVLLMLFTALAYFVARRPVERMESRLADSPWKAAAVGLAAQILFLPALVVTIVVLAVSIIGIPLLLLVPFAIFALAIGAVFGFAAVALRAGRGAEERFGWHNAGAYVSLLVGVGLVMAVSFFASALGLAGGPLGVFAAVLTVLGFVIQYAAWTMGFGALLLTRFGTRLSWGDGGPGTGGAPPPGEPVHAPAHGPPPTETRGA